MEYLFKKVIHQSCTRTLQIVSESTLNRNPFAMMEILLPVGTHCAIIQSYEFELILPYGCKFKLISETIIPKTMKYKSFPYLIFDLIYDGIC